MAKHGPTLAGKTVVVTGSSRGIGAAIAKRIACNGANLILHGRTKSKGLIETLGAIQKFGNSAVAFPSDFADRDQQLEFVENCFAWRGKVDAWIHAAGADVLTTGLRKAGFSERLDVLLQVDVAAAVIMLNEVGRRMRDSHPEPGSASIVTIGWDQAEHGMEGEAGLLFGTTKAAVMAFSKSLAHCFSPQVRVNCIAAGWIQTGWGKNASEAWQVRARRESLQDRWGMAEDVANLAAFLVGPESGFVNGQVIACNGGFRHGYCSTEQSGEDDQN